MPKLSRWFIKLGMIYLAAALLMGTLLLLQPVTGISSSVQTLRPVYLHFIFIGWVTQIIMGIGYWMFPKYSKDQPRRSEKVGWGVLISLNIGLLLRAVGEPAVVLAPQARLGWVLAAASLLLLLAGWGFIFNTWSRIRER
ncbi:hypothetical protein FBR02_10345 [Anaerolineae bacterium CFX9]|nr:hypothetical protein [Anaerolineae bacterium CFX9]